MGPCVYKPGILVHLLVSLACCNGLTLRGFNTNSVEAEGRQCKQSKSEKV